MEKKKRKRRTKAEIEAAKANESQGLGDTVEKVLEATGISKIAKWILGEDCGCDERKQKLNELFPYKKPLCLEEDEYQYLQEFFHKNTTRIRPSEQSRLLAIHNRVFQERNEPTTCSSCWVNYLNKLRKVYNTYDNANS